MIECLNLTIDEVAALVDAGWTLLGGPYDNETDCLAACSSGSGTSGSGTSGSGTSGSGSGPETCMGTCECALPAMMTITGTSSDGCEILMNGTTSTLPLTSSSPCTWFADYTVEGTDVGCELLCNGDGTYTLTYTGFTTGNVVTVISCDPVHLQVTGNGTAWGCTGSVLFDITE